MLLVVEPTGTELSTEVLELHQVALISQPSCGPRPWLRPANIRNDGAPSPASWADDVAGVGAFLVKSNFCVHANRNELPDSGAGSWGCDPGEHDKWLV